MSVLTSYFSRKGVWYGYKLVANVSMNVGDVWHLGSCSEPQWLTKTNKAKIYCLPASYPWVLLLIDAIFWSLKVKAGWWPDILHKDLALDLNVGLIPSTVIHKDFFESWSMQKNNNQVCNSFITPEIDLFFWAIILDSLLFQQVFTATILKPDSNNMSVFSVPHHPAGAAHQEARGKDIRWLWICQRVYGRWADGAFVPCSFETLGHSYSDIKGHLPSSLAHIDVLTSSQSFHYELVFVHVSWKISMS